MPVQIKTKRVGTMLDKPRSQKSNLDAVIDKLKSEPGVWFEIRRYSGTRTEKQAGYVYAHNCRTGKNKLSPANGIDVFASVQGEFVVVYARYVGGRR